MDDESSLEQGIGSVKRYYSAPELVLYGKVSSITLGGGSIPQPDGVSGMGMGPPDPLGSTSRSRPTRPTRGGG